MMMARKEAATRVFWDMSTCPVPDGYDAGRVGPCIKRALKKLGYTGGVSITGLGILRDVSTYILQILYSSGVSLSNLRMKCFGLQRTISGWKMAGPPWDNLMLIFAEKNFVGYLGMLELNRVHVIQGLPFDHLQTAFNPIERLVWERFQVADGVDSGDLEEDLEEDPGWSCEVCRSNGQGFENFSMHLKHKLHVSILLATQEEEEEYEEY
ncbi:NYN domain limkain-b1-type [Arabidopsis suecica]|uniref:NYN domain limkain-b1-type n=1 Tax=Arabidopsis suecica TaxID=45249 RepID=A0A8T1ZYB4_ARASU|nr:NYN domain limkain-b1-type [Arabidopsis suecica]